MAHTDVSIAIHLRIARHDLDTFQILWQVLMQPGNKLEAFRCHLFRRTEAVEKRGNGPSELFARDLLPGPDTTVHVFQDAIQIRAIVEATEKRNLICPQANTSFGNVLIVVHLDWILYGDLCIALPGHETSIIGEVLLLLVDAPELY